MNYDIIVIGSGASSYAYLKGLESNSELKSLRIAVVSPQMYKSTTQPIEKKDISPKFLQQKNLLSYSYFLDTFGHFHETLFTMIGIHGIGGMARIWGSSVGVFDKESLQKNGLDCEDMYAAYKSLDTFLPVCGNEKDELFKHFNLSESKTVTISSRVKRLYGKHLNGDLLIGAPRLLVKDNCKSCNQCLSGCEENSIWYPMKEDFDNLDLNVDFLEGVYVEKLYENRILCSDKNDEEMELTFSHATLAAGVFQNYKLLCSLSEVKDKKSIVYNTPAMAFAFLDLSKNKFKEFFGMGNATFVLKEQQKGIFYGNLYDGYSLATSKGKVFSKNFVMDKLMKFASRFMVAGAGFTSSNNSHVSIDLKNNEIEIKAEQTKLYETQMNHIQTQLRKFFLENRKIKVQFKKANFGADIHYAGGVPNDLLDKTTIQDGKLKGIESIITVGGSNFQYLPPMSPTFSFMANAYRIGKQFSTKEINGLS